MLELRFPLDLPIWVHKYRNVCLSEDLSNIDYIDVNLLFVSMCIAFQLSP